MGPNTYSQGIWKTRVWVFPRIVVPQNGWFIINGKPYEQMDDLGVPLFLEIPIFHVYIGCGPLQVTVANEGF